MILVIKGFTCGKQLKLPVLFRFFSLDNIKHIHDLKNIVNYYGCTNVSNERKPCYIIYVLKNVKKIKLCDNPNEQIGIQYIALYQDNICQQ